MEVYKLMQCNRVTLGGKWGNITFQAEGNSHPYLSGLLGISGTHQRPCLPLPWSILLLVDLHDVSKSERVGRQRLRAHLFLELPRKVIIPSRDQPEFEDFIPGFSQGDNQS